MVVLTAPIKTINIYNNHARITRTGHLKLSAGLHLVTLADLPASLENDSVRVMSSNLAVKIMDVEMNNHLITSNFPEELSELQTAFDLLQDEDETLRDEDRLEQEQQLLLQDICTTISRSLGEGLAQGTVPLENMDNLLAHIAKQRKESQQRRRKIVHERNQLEQKMRELQAQTPPGYQLLRRNQDNTLEAPAVPLNGDEAERSTRRLGDAPSEAPENAQRMLPPTLQRHLITAEHSEHQRKTILISVKIETEAEVELSVSYKVPNVSWEPFYDLRMLGDQLTMTFMAHIRQQTGENWPEVPLILSTARPTLNTNPPKIRPWMIDVEKPAAVPSLLQRLPFGRPPTPTNDESNSRRSPFGRPPTPSSSPSPFQSQPPSLGNRPTIFGRRQGSPVTATDKTTPPDSNEIKSSMPVMVFTPDQLVAIPCDNSVRKIFISSIALQCELDYITIPSQNEEAYLCARIKNTSDEPLLAGQALIFYGSQYVGKTDIKTTAPGESFTIQAGEQEAIRVRRQLIEHATVKAPAQNVSRTEFIYRITLTNEMDAPTSITVYDHLPITRNENIKVFVRAISPQPLDRTDSNIFTWKIALEPNERQEIVLGFALEHPKDMKIVSKNS